MARLWKKRLLVFGLTPVMALAAAACSGGGDDDPFRIGVMESLTGPGETYGTVASQAKQMAVDEINAAGGVDGAYLIELVVEDSKCGAQDAIAAYKKLTEVEGIKIILGTSCSGAMLGVGPACGGRRHHPVLGAGEQSRTSPRPATTSSAPRSATSRWG